MIDYAALGIAALGGLVWGLRLEGRVNVHDAILSDIKADLSKIMEKLDYLVGFRRRD